jgi:hypothetical protein
MSRYPTKAMERVLARCSSDKFAAPRRFNNMARIPGPRTPDCPDCGAKWHGAQFKGVALCPLHAAATDLLKAAKRLCEEGVCPRNMDALRAAITKAAKGER